MEVAHPVSLHLFELAVKSQFSTTNEGTVPGQGWALLFRSATEAPVYFYVT